MNRSVNIGGNEVGDGQPVFIIAEAGVNHNGDLDLALQLVREAANSGADCIKFQTFRAEQVARLSAPKAAYQLEVTDKQESQFEMLKNLELNPDYYEAIIRECTECGIVFMSTPYHPDDADFLEELDIVAYKIASATIVEDALLYHVAAKNKPVILSTGMAELDEVLAAVEVVRSAGNNQIVLLQCTTDYPAEISEVNLRAMQTIRDETACLVGFSDHVESDYASFAAVAMGACVIEKHFTLDRSLPGPDHKASLEPASFVNLVHGIREIEKSLGSPRKAPSESELRNIVGMRRSIVAVRDLRAGEVLEKTDLCFKRPGNGMAPSTLSRVLGRKLRKSVSADEPLEEADILW